MKISSTKSLGILAVIVTGFAFTRTSQNINPEEPRTTHHMKGRGYDHQFETKKGMTAQLSTVGTTYDKPDGTYGYRESQCINIAFANGYDFNVYHDSLSISAKYAEITDPDASQEDFKVLEKGSDYLIYKAREGKTPFHAVLVNVKIGNEYFSTVTEQIHFDMKDRPLTIGLEDCREVVKILRSIRKAK